MIFILPSFYDNFQDNQNILNLYNNYVRIKGMQGAFPSSIMKGGINSLDLRLFALYDDMIESINSYDTSCKNFFIDCGNIALDKKDFYNMLNKICFEEWGNNSSFFFEIADFDLLDFLVEKYPQIQITLHSNIFFKYTLKQIQEKIDKCDNIKNIIIPRPMMHVKINNIKKIYLMSFFKCQEACVNYKDCVIKENHQILEYSKKSTFRNCKHKSLKNEEEFFKEYQNIPKDFDTIMFGNIIPEESNDCYTLIINLFDRSIKNDLL